MVVLALMLVLLSQLTSATQKTWTSTVGKVEQFRDARQAFEAITRRLSQATLNTYWDYALNTAGVPTDYVRQSELRFISGNTTALQIDSTGSSGAPLRPTQAVFFQAPLGVVANTTDYHGLDNVLNTWGYCIEYADDSATRPTFLSTLARPPATRNRFRLVELQEPSDSFSLYQREYAKNTSAPPAAPTGGNAAYTAKDWYSTPLGAVPPANTANPPARPVHVLAENVVALIILPKLSREDETPAGGLTYTDSSLCPYYLYDSTSTSNNAATSPNPPAGSGSITVDRNLNPKNQLPSVVQVTMVAVDELSFGRLLSSRSDQTAPPDFQAPANGSATPLFQTVGDTVNAGNAGYAKDLQTLETNLQSYHLNYRVFTTAVSIKAAKWSNYQTK